MTPHQIEQWNTMRETLIKIAKEYDSPMQIMKTDYSALDMNWDEIMAMSYLNMQKDASEAVKGVKQIKK